MAGQIAGMVSKEQTCKEMIDEMMAQAETASWTQVRVKRSKSDE